MIVVDVGELGIPHNAQPFAKGAVGELYKVPNALPVLPGRTLVFKRVKAKLDAKLEAKLGRAGVLAQMRAVVAMRDTMSPTELAELDGVAVWPLAVVREAGEDQGILLDLIRPEFFVDTRPVNHPADRTPFELQFLCVSDKYLDIRGIDRSLLGDDVMRLALSARLAYAIEVVHRRPVVFGDLHLKNAVAATRPFAQVLLIDCDSVAELADSRRVQLHGHFMAPPEMGQQELQDQETDVYKLGVCIIRALSRGNGATQETDPTNTIPGLLDREGVEILRRAVGTDRDRRPRAWELTEYLVRRVRSLIQLPELRSAELSHRVALRGSEVFVRWDQRYGTEVRIFGSNGFTEHGIDANKHTSGYPIRPTHAGPIDVEVWNKHGPSTRLRAGYLDYYELPSLDIAGQLRGIPRPVIPQVPALDARTLHALRPYPVARHPDLSIEVTTPTLRYPALTIDAGAGQAGTGSVAGPTAAVERAQRTANATIDRTVSQAMRRMTTALRKRLDSGIHGP